MATINGLVTCNDVWYLSVDIDPSSGAGTKANIGSHAQVTDGSGEYYKYGNADTEWIKLQIGSQGTQGSQGNIGVQGSQGLSGTQGFQGNIGVQGFQGNIGSQGFQGIIGNQGSQGLSGTQGSQGSQGTGTGSNQIIYYNSQGVISNNDFLVWGNNPTGTEVEAQFVCTKSGTLRNLFVSLVTAPGAGSPTKSRTFTVRKNGVDTALLVTISSTATTGSNIANTVSVVAFDLISLRQTQLNTPASVGSVRATFEIS